MKTKEFLKKHDACPSGSRWALSISEDMADVWDAMIEQGMHDWLIWTATRPGVFSDSVLRKLACRFVRETPLSDGRTVWDLLTDERSRKAVDVAELYADGKATAQELETAYSAAAAYTAHDTVRAAYAAAAARAAAYDDAYAAADDAARDAALAAARAAYAAARDAAYAATDAADDAVRAAAYAATDAAARDVAREVAYDAAYDAAYAAASDAVCVAASSAAYAAASSAAYDAARDAAKAAQVRMIVELGNPLRKGRRNENERIFETA